MLYRLIKIFLFLLILSFNSQIIMSQEKGEESETVVIPAYTPTGNEPKVTVIDFSNESFFVSDVLGKAATIMFQSALVESGRFILVERSLLNAKIEELNLSSQELTNDELLNICKLLNIKYIISGSVTEFGIKKTGTTVRTTVTDKNSKMGGGLSMEMGKGTSRVCIDIKFTDVTSKQVSFSASVTGISTSKNSIFGLELLSPVKKIGTNVAFSGGVEGFDQTLAGKSMRNASRLLILKVIDSNTFK